MDPAARSFDVIVIGAGPAGSYLAEKVARAGHEVALVEEHREIGEPIQCGGLVTPRVFEYVDCKETIIGQVHGAELYSPKGRKIVIDGHETEAVVVQRALFDRAIASNAVRAGAHTFLGAQAQSSAQNCRDLMGSVDARRLSLSALAAEEATGRHLVAIVAGGGELREPADGIQA